MSRKLVTVIPSLASEHVERIRIEAKRLGFEADYFENCGDAQEALSQAEVVFGQDERLPRLAPHLKWLCSPSAGINQFCAPKGTFPESVMLTNSSGAYGVTIAEHIFMVTLEMQRRQMEYDALAREHIWKRDLPVRSIYGSRILLLGTGDIGRQAAKRLRAFEPKAILGVSLSGKAEEGFFDNVFRSEALPTLLPQTDILIISLPGTALTYHMFDGAMLDMLPEGALIVNVGRGSVIDFHALEARLRAGRLRAALDVFENEPLKPDDPAWQCPNLLLTQHTAGNMTLPYTVRRIVDMFLEDLERYACGGKLLHLADRKKGY